MCVFFWCITNQFLFLFYLEKPRSFFFYQEIKNYSDIELVRFYITFFDS